ncbi:DUF2808 domain-containing protein [Phormidesmis priestleyi ULC007]|uniref:DUF2808 domain-containing protein n=1 Tax=Phormidesmis priestleyi ULC007 TaxID=1920490 RepID=A0A2T1DFK1_9CYAN|nr:DUF2808 domain-containing protein [Phormidesmis priestleyi]PSB19221.1 DUF2808 domain-containing protein [Phormidesmis priestleyi ULC007]PZO48176.1 MAG: DUF2808 domain-containing protein [Phormidesmis priestleyi]
MSQIQEILTLAIASTLLATSTTVAQYNTPSDDSTLMPEVTTTSGYEMEESLKQSQATVSDDSYSFTMTLPQADSGFTKLSLSLTKPDRDNTIVPIHLNLKGTTAFVGTSTTGAAIAVKDAWIDETGTVWVEFNSPVAAKTTLTVVFKTQKPLAVGQYVYSIAAYPNTKPSVAVFVDSGTVKI